MTELTLSKDEKEQAKKFREEKMLSDPESVQTQKLLELASNEKDEKYWQKVREETLSLLAQIGRKPEATEHLVKEILSINHIHTIRNDEASEMWIYFSGIYIPHAKTFIKEFCRGILKDAFTTNFASQVIAKIEADTYTDSEQFFGVKNANEIAVENGILNLKTRNLRDFNKEDIFFNKINARYDSTLRCTNIIKHLKQVLKNKQDIPVIQELIGYVLYRKHPIEKAFMLSGTGRNGKGKTLELIKRFVGAENCVNIPIQTLQNDPFAKGELLNKLANLGADISANSLKESSVFKEITGNDQIGANRKFKPFIYFQNYSKQIFSANDIPITYDVSPAFWTRWIILEFPYQFLSKREISKISKEKRENIRVADTEIVDKLTTDIELSGFLNWALDGLDRLLKQKDFSYTPSMEDVKVFWLRKSNNFYAFCMDCLEVEWEGKITKEELRWVYSDYCKEHKLQPKGDKTIKNTLLIHYSAFEDRYRMDNQQTSYWSGIKFKSGILGKVGEGFSTYSKNTKLPLDEKKGVFPTIHTKLKNLKDEKTLTKYTEPTEEKIEE